MTDWRKLLVDEQLWDYRCKAVPVPLVREIVEEVETLRQDLAAARAEVERLRAGGCARNQRTTQWCQEAEDVRKDLAAARARVAELEAAYAALGKENSAVHARALQAESDLAAAQQNIRKLTARAINAELRADSENDWLQRCIDAEADLAAAWADAERYRWLRSAQTGKPLSVVTTGSAWRCTLNTVELDEAIDAALAGEKK